MNEFGPVHIGFSKYGRPPNGRLALTFLMQEGSAKAASASFRARQDNPAMEGAFKEGVHAMWDRGLSLQIRP